MAIVIGLKPGVWSKQDISRFEASNVLLVWRFGVGGLLDVVMFMGEGEGGNKGKRGKKALDRVSGTSV